MDGQQSRASIGGYLLSPGEANKTFVCSLTEPG